MTKETETIPLVITMVVHTSVDPDRLCDWLRQLFEAFKLTECKSIMWNDPRDEEAPF